MLEYLCDTCHRRKKAGQDWIMGLAAQSAGRQSERREIRILPAWNNAQAVHPLAVHFCSQRCQEKYTNWLFSYQIAS
jgi:hypothetical protein